MQQVDTHVFGDKPAGLKSCLGESAISDVSQSFSTALAPITVLQTLLSEKSQEARQVLAGQLTYSQDYAATRHLLVKATQQRNGAYQPLKRCLDVSVAGTLLIALLPLFAIVAMAILIDTGMPIFYFQPRIGRNGKSFRFYKFRTMIRNADALKKHLAHQNEASGPIFKMRNDPRVTHVGRLLRRLSIDELPQLVNVLRGDISLIGPRPLVGPEAATCNERQQLRHVVQPGLLCLREISGRSALSFEEWMELDLLYVANQSFAADIRVLLNAIPAILCGNGAY